MKKLILPLVLLSITTQTYALETDQFLAASHELKDASGPLNEYMNKAIDQAVKNASEEKESVSCVKVSDMVMSEIVGKFSISKISQFAKKSPLIERFPDDSIGDFAYIDQSIYTHAGFPFFMGLIARTINVGGIYVGTDKLGHFALLGRNYYRRFQDELKKNKNNELAAEKETVFGGITTEVAVLGYKLGGVLSYGDLEANFQGFTFARSLCEGSNPYLIKSNNEWQRTNRQFNFNEYFSPKMDESFKPAFWTPRVWKNIKDDIRKSYCEVKNNPLYQARISKYPARLSSNRNDDYIKEYFKNKPNFDRSLRDIDKLCE
jgi:hypothetical protein